MTTPQEPYWLTIARAEIGQAEIPGNVANSRIVQYFTYTTYKATSDEIPWCSAYGCFCMERAGIPSPKSARTIDWLTWGTRILKPRAGCVMILNLGTNFHFSFWAGEDPTHVHGLGGNQHNMVNITRFPKVAVVEYRWPTQEALAKMIVPTTHQGEEP